MNYKEQKSPSSLLAIVKLVVLFVVVVSQTAMAEEKPNIVFIFADDLGWGDLSAHGSPTIRTPNLDQLAKAGSEFYQFSVASPVCSPSRTAVITGHFPSRHNVFHHFADIEHHEKFAMPDWLDPDVVTMPRVLKKAGYVTGHFGKWHLTNSHIPDAPLPANYGYDESTVFNGPGKQTDTFKAYDDAIDFIRRHKDSPFFLNLWLHEPHTPHYPEQESMADYAQLDEQQRAYAAVVGGADRHIGRLLQVIKKLELEENTLVVFSSDNGPEITGDESKRYLRTDPDAKVPGIEPLGHYFSVGTTAGLRGRKRDIYEGGVRVPFIVRWPGKIPAGKVDTTSVVSAVDLLPTFAAAAGAELPNSYQSDGENMMPLFLGGDVERQKPLFWEWYARPINTDKDYERSVLAVRDGEWKLTWDRINQKTELYNIFKDRAENQNLVERYPEKVQELKTMALQWKKTLPRSPNTKDYSTLRKR